MSARIRHFLSLVLPLLLAAPAAPQATASQAGAQPDRQVFQDEARVFAVEVPVHVVGRDGQPVRGLTAADFEVFDEGKRQTLSNFEVVDLERLSRMEPAAGAAAGAPPLHAAARRRLLLLFDLSFSTPASVVKARQAARDFVLTSLQPSDLVAVATFSLEAGPRLLVTFTPDRAQLARAVDTLGTLGETQGKADPLRFVVEQPSSVSASRTLDAETSDLKRANADAALYEHLTAISLYAEKMSRSFEQSRITAMTRSLGDMARWLDNVKGRKHVLFFSEGFDSRLFLGRTETDPETVTDQDYAMHGRLEYVDSDSRFGNTALQGDVQRMLEEFRRADCVIEAVDVGGLRNQADATEAPRRAGKDVLFYMANETGGELMEDSNDLGRHLGRVLTRTSLTYLLTFQRSDLEPDGAYRRLRIKVKGLPPGARVSHRSGYYAPRPFQSLHPLEKNLLASDGIANALPRRDLDLRVLAAPFRATPDRAYVPVIIEVGGGALLAGRQGDQLNVELFAYASDEKGEMKDFFTRTVGLDMGKGGKSRDAVRDTGIKYYGHLDLPPGRYRVRILVRDAETGKTAVEAVPLTVPDWRDARLQLLPPLFLDAARWLLVREPGDGDGAVGEGSVVYPFTVNGEPYVPAARPRLAAGDEARLCLVAYNLGEGNPLLHGEVLAADGQVVTGPAGDTAGGRLSGVERTATGLAGVDKLLATFRPAGLVPGDYTLRVRVTDPVTGAPEISSAPFSVVERGDS
ncbi:MAG TPA: VWA domain-containing protein [Thermoanaerobaculia bacterium]|nr:VWA domain-containing protein [Thermoanaerobaculia bacterium]